MTGACGGILLAPPGALTHFGGFLILLRMKVLSPCNLTFQMFYPLLVWVTIKMFSGITMKRTSQLLYDMLN